MTPDRLLLSEGINNFIAAIGLGAYLAQICRNRTRSLLESRLSIFLSSLMLIYGLRAVHYSMGAGPLLKSFVLFASAMLPFALVLFIEGLLRRHFHIVIKLFSMTGSLALGVWALTATAGSWYFAALASFQVIVLAIVVYTCLNRDQATLSESENRYINGIGVAAIVAVPLLVSDFRAVFSWDIPRMGALGGLVFAYSLVKLSEKHRKRDISKELVYIMAIDLVGAAIFCLIWKDFASFMIAYSVILTMHFFILLVKQLVLQERSKIQDWVFGLVESIQTKKVQEIADFHGLLLERMGTQSILPITEENLSGFNIAALKTLFDSQDVLELPALRKAAGHCLAAQQMAYLLESHQMNQAHMIGKDPFYLILVNAPAIGKAGDYQNEMQILKSFLSLIQRKSHE